MFRRSGRTPPHCPTCTAPTNDGWRWCEICGNRLNPPWWSVRSKQIIAIVVVVAFLAAARIFFGTLWEGDLVAAGGPPETTAAPAVASTLPALAAAPPTTPAPPPSEPQRPSSFSASATAGVSQNACGDQTRYDVAYLLDGAFDTGWRAKGDGTGERLTFTFSGPTRLSQVGLVPGYAKIDPCNGQDRFRQQRRVLAVRWIFDGATTVDQTFAETPSMQTIPVDVVATTVDIEILVVTSSPEIDHTPLSEVSFLGGPP